MDIVYWEADSLPQRGHCEFFTEYVPNRREYRLHVYRGEVIRTQGKYLDFPEQWTRPFVKNYEQGFRFRTPRLELNRSRVEAAVRAVEALGLVHGAVDLLIGEDGLEYVLEVNTAPSCSPLTARRYIERMAADLNITPNYEPLDRLRG
jgi:glutathione synthase/RimK-type ligase-like ATP-grasp enzyme